MPGLDPIRANIGKKTWWELWNTVMAQIDRVIPPTLMSELADGPVEPNHGGKSAISTTDDTHLARMGLDPSITRYNTKGPKH
jgi:hypothetical protein